jgi:hypothetical protein
MDEQEPVIEADLPSTTDSSEAEIVVGARVLSFDFPMVEQTMVEGEHACWYEGVVEGICRNLFHDCPRYAIRVERQVFAGKEVEDLIGEHIFPPLNGLEQTLSSGLTCGVELIEKSLEAAPE